MCYKYNLIEGKDFKDDYNGHEIKKMVSILSKEEIHNIFTKQMGSIIEWFKGSFEEGKGSFITFDNSLVEFYVSEYWIDDLTEEEYIGVSMKIRGHILASRAFVSKGKNNIEELETFLSMCEIKAQKTYIIIGELHEIVKGVRK